MEKFVWLGAASQRSGRFAASQTFTEFHRVPHDDNVDDADAFVLEPLRHPYQQLDRNADLLKDGFKAGRRKFSADVGQFVHYTEGELFDAMFDGWVRSFERDLDFHSPVAWPDLVVEVLKHVPYRDDMVLVQAVAETHVVPWIAPPKAKAKAKDKAKADSDSDADFLKGPVVETGLTARASGGDRCMSFRQ